MNLYSDREKFKLSRLTGTGPQGPVGPQGTQGPQGWQGPQGSQGPQGLDGPQGIDGAPGPQGPIGLTGPQGPQGLQGLDGPQGVDGSPGPQGVDGSQGPQGPIGLTGPQGPQGLQGLNGPQGVDGSPGPIGLTGPQGPQGLQGPQGVDGSQGPQGPIGLTGPQGPIGLTGPNKYSCGLIFPTVTVSSTSLVPISLTPDFSYGNLTVDNASGVVTTPSLTPGIYEIYLSTHYLVNTTVASPNISLSLDSVRLVNRQFNRSTSSTNHLPWSYSTVVDLTSGVHTLLVEALIGATPYQVTFKSIYLSMKQMT